MKRLRQKTTAIVLGLLFGIGLAYAGLETVTHIQDLNASWPLGSDLASTSDDHIRNIKSALKTDFPNFNGTYTSAALPVFAIPSDTNTGMYSVGADDLGFSTGGTLRFDISTTAFTGTLPWRGQDGTVGAPAISFSGDTNTGIYRAASDEMILVTGGVNAIYMDSGQRARFVDGTALLPAVTFQTDTDTGIYRGSANFLGLVAGGVRTVGISSTQAFLLDGSAAVPSLSFDSDADTGFYRDTANQIGIALGGSTAGQIAQGTFTGTLTGYASGPTGTVNYQRVGKIVTLWITAAITGTSNANTMTMTGLPAVVQPASNVVVSTAALSDASTSSGPGGLFGSAQINGGTITFTLATGGTPLIVGGNNTFAATGTKGLFAGWTITYPIS